MAIAITNNNIIKLTSAETSREIKKHLKKMFPHMERLSVTTKHFSIRIKWLNGPSPEAVKKATWIFEGSKMVQNGGDMIKAPSGPVEYQGKQVDFGIDFIFCERTLSEENQAIIAKYVQDKYGEDDTPNQYRTRHFTYEIEQEIDAKDIPTLVWAHIESTVAQSAPAIETAPESPALPEPQEDEALPMPSTQDEEIQQLIDESCYHIEVIDGRIMTYEVWDTLSRVDICYTRQEAEETIVRRVLAERSYAETEVIPSLKPQETLPENIFDEVEEAEDTTEQAVQMALDIHQALLEQEAKRIVEAKEVEQVNDPCSNPDADVFYRFDKVSHIHWLEFPGKPDEETRNLLKKDGWRWSNYRKQWYNNRRWTTVPEGIEYYNDGYCDYASERADRLEERAEKKLEKYQQHREKSDRISSMIPFGQPILVGHHSERRHRSDLEKIRNNELKAYENYRASERLESNAESSRRHQAYAESVGAIHRRIQRLETDLRAYHRNKIGWGNEQEWQRRVSSLEQEIAENKAKLEALGGIKADHLNVEKGDIIRIDGSIARVDTKPRKGGKTYTYTIIEGGARGMRLTSDRSELQAIVKKHNEIQAS